MEVEVINDVFSRVQVEAPQRFRNLSIFPVLGNGRDIPPYLLLTEAMERGVLEVREVDEGRVSELLVINQAERDVLFVCGEELLGAKQNRTVNMSLMVGAGTSLIVPVSCTERGRWHEGEWGRRMAKVSNHYSSSFIRATLLDSVSDSIQIIGSFVSDQGSIWSQIEETASTMRVGGETEAQTDIFEAKREEIEDYEDHFSCLPDQCGMIGMIRGKIRGFDLFGYPDTLGKNFKRMLRSYILEAIVLPEAGGTGTERLTYELVNELQNSRMEEVIGPGKGEHLLLQGKRHKAMGLMDKGRLVHLYGI